MTTDSAPRTEAGRELRELLLSVFREVKQLVPEARHAEDPAGFILAIEAEAALPGPVSPEAPLDVERLWQIIDKRWPHHIEGTGGTGDVRHTQWDVIDPAIPTREWLDEVVAEYARLAAPAVQEEPHD